MNTTTNTRVSEAMVDGPALLQIARDVGLREVMFNVSAERAIPLLQAFFSAALEAALSAEPAAQGEDAIRRAQDEYENACGEPASYVGIEAVLSLTAPPAQPAERVPEGWVLVPREPTEAMRRRGADRWIEASENAMTRKDEEEAARCAWAAMLAAAPADGKEGVR